jgi:hypothetical protein
MPRLHPRLARLARGLLVLLSASLVALPASATSAFEIVAEIGFGIGRIVPLDAGAEATDLGLLASFDPQPDSYYVDGTGGFSASADNPAVLETLDPAPSARFAHTFRLAGTAAPDGAVELAQTGWYELALFNGGAGRLAVEVVFDYALSASANGAFAAADLVLDWFDDFGTSGFAFVLADAATAPLDQVAESGLLFNFLLEPGSGTSLYVDVTGSAYAVGATTPVPAPLAVWCLASGMACLLRFARRGSGLAG